MINFIWISGFHPVLRLKCLLQILLKINISATSVRTIVLYCQYLTNSRNFQKFLTIILQTLYKAPKIQNFTLNDFFSIVSVLYELLWSDAWQFVIIFFLIVSANFRYCCRFCGGDVTRKSWFVLHYWKHTLQYKATNPGNWNLFWMKCSTENSLRWLNNEKVQIMVQVDGITTLRRCRLWITIIIIIKEGFGGYLESHKAIILKSNSNLYQKVLNQWSNYF